MSAPDVVAALGRASVLGALAALVAGAVLAASRGRIPAALRVWVWWLVAAQFVVGLAPRASLDAARLPAPVAALGTLAAPPAALAPLAAPAAALESLAEPVRRGLDMPEAAAVAAWAALLVWLAGMTWISVRHLRARGRLERAWRAAAPHLAGEAVAAEIRVTHELSIPMALAGRRPRILLPGEWRQLNEESRSLVLAHECAHLARRDLVWGWVPVVAETIFWFHPLARWSVREYGQAREEACDERALRVTRGSPRAYGEVLVRFGVVPRSTPSAASCGSPNRAALLRRLRMLDRSITKSFWGRAAGLCLVAAGVVALLPLRLEAGAEHRDASTKDKGARQIVRYGHRGPTAELDIDRFAHLLVEADGKRSTGAMQIGDGRNDAEDARRAQRAHGGEVWWFRFGRDQYVVADEAITEQVRQAHDAVQEIERLELGPFEEQLRLFDDTLFRTDRRLDRETREVEALERQKSRLRGLSAEEREERLAELERATEARYAARESIYETREQIYREREEVYQQREAVYQELEKEHAVVARKLYQIAREAVASGAARRTS